MQQKKYFIPLWKSVYVKMIVCSPNTISSIKYVYIHGAFMSEYDYRFPLIYFLKIIDCTVFV